MIKRFNDYIKENLRDKMTPVSDEKIDGIINDLDFDLVGVELEEKGNFGQDLIDIYATKNKKRYYKLGQIRVLKDLVIFYPDFRKLEEQRLSIHNDIPNSRELTKEEKRVVILQLNKDKKMSSLLDDFELWSYLEIISRFIKFVENRK